jgi:hypothetical protein
MNASHALDVVQRSPVSQRKGGTLPAPEEVASRLQEAFGAAAADAVRQTHQAGHAVPVLGPADRLVWLHPDGTVRATRDLAAATEHD